MTIEVFAGVNGWGYSCTQGTTQIGADAKLYGDATGQFPELAQLWSTYRLDSLTVIWQPAQFGAGYHSPIASCVDPAGETSQIGTASADDIVATFSRLRSFKLHSSLAKACRVS